MLLCLVKVSFGWHGWSFSGLGGNCFHRSAGCGQDREGPLRCGGQALIRSRGQQAGMGSGDSRQIDSRPAQGAAADLRVRPPPGSWGLGGAEVAVDLAGDVALQAADDLVLRQAFGGAPLDVGARRRVSAHPGEHDPPQRVVGLAVAARVESPAGDFPRRGGDRGDRAQVRPGGLRPQPFRVVPGRDQQQGSGVGADAVQGEQAGCAGSDEGDDELVEPLDLAVEEFGAPSQLAQRDAGG
jgi:hypothetical protein